ncbi:MAG: hypothetical protein J6X44_06975, partial [Thermoguttaceae bacterium]|nr:hypothetical protein [Thermoguttaceae bacterium]
SGHVSSYYSVMKWYQEEEDMVRIQIISELEQGDFREFAPGLWFPNHYKSHSYVDDPEKGSFFERFINNIEINGNYSDFLSGFSFPDGMSVDETGEDGFHPLIHVWGKKGKPAKTFKNEDEWIAYLTNDCGFEIRRPQQLQSYKQPSKSRYVFLALGVALIALSLLIRRRRVHE